MHRYETVIYWDDTDQAFIAEVPDLPGCLAHGRTDVEALLQSREAVELWIAVAREQGEPIPEPSRHSATCS